VGFSELSGWIAVALIPTAAFSAWLLRRIRAGRFTVRMRPHYFAGYGALGLALVHMFASMPGVAGADATGIQIAALALTGLGAQAFLGTNLQSPGSYRKPLRRWHLTLFAATLVLVAIHVILDASMFSATTSWRDPGSRRHSIASAVTISYLATAPSLRAKTRLHSSTARTDDMR
jgi:hypothetical protein